MVHRWNTIFRSLSSGIYRQAEIRAELSRYHQNFRLKTEADLVSNKLCQICYIFEHWKGDSKLCIHRVGDEVTFMAICHALKTWRCVEIKPLSQPWL